MFSATMAAISSDLNAIASVLTRDVYFRLINPNSSERKLVRVGRLSTLSARRDRYRAKSLDRL